VRTSIPEGGKVRAGPNLDIGTGEEVRVVPDLDTGRVGR